MVQIEIDEQVYEWLQGLVERPFEDTPNAVLRRLSGIDTSNQAGRPSTTTTALPPTPVAASPGTLQPPPRTSVTPLPGRPKINGKALVARRVRHFVVAGRTPDYAGKKAHPRAYLDGMLDANLTTTPYFERWNEEGRPNPRGDAASRVFLTVGSQDYTSEVVFESGESMKVAEFVRDFLAGR